MRQVRRTISGRSGQMFGPFGAKRGDARTFLGRLRRDVRGNTLAIMALALIPLAGLVGGGIDMARLYVVKSRLQHACDAGALAGRKAMGGGMWNQSNNMPAGVADQFFNGNFVNGSYGSLNLAHSFSENTGKVTGTASADVPMTLMRIFGFTQTTVSVTCDAEMRLPNTDVMFVLDTTGSMGSPLPGDTQTKIDALRVAVKCFYEIVARLDTNAVCTTGTPSGGLGSQVQVRFGFVPFSTNVNVGRLLPTEYFANKWPYQSREAAKVPGTFNSWYGSTPTLKNGGAWSAWANTGVQATANNSQSCISSLVPIPADTYQITSDYSWPANNPTLGWPDNGTETSAGWRGYVLTTQTTYRLSYSSSARTCYQQSQTRTVLRDANWDRVANPASPPANAYLFPAWTYKQTTVDVSGLKAGSGVNWNSSTTVPLGNNYANKTLTWDGCIEERKTIAASSYDPIPSGARDLDIDGVPSQSDPDSLWAPALQGLIYERRASYDNSGAYSTNPITTFWQSFGGPSYSCAVPAHKLEQWTDPTLFDQYVDSLSAGGNTYHDLGLLWGARLMSPTGIFASENAYTPQNGEIQRNLIFMTDGEACTTPGNYQGYGIAWYDRRETDPTVDPGAMTTQTCSTDTNPGILTNQVDARTAALCSAVKNKNITLWVVYFGSASSNVAAHMTTCASPGRFFQAANAAALQQTFAQIANQISQLRLTN